MKVKKIFENIMLCIFILSGIYIMFFPKIDIQEGWFEYDNFTNEHVLQCRERKIPILGKLYYRDVDYKKYNDVYNEYCKDYS